MIASMIWSLFLLSLSGVMYIQNGESLTIPGVAIQAQKRLRLDPSVSKWLESHNFPAKIDRPIDALTQNLRGNTHNPQPSVFCSKFLRDDIPGYDSVTDIAERKLMFDNLGKALWQGLGMLFNCLIGGEPGQYDPGNMLAQVAVGLMRKPVVLRLPPQAPIPSKSGGLLTPPERSIDDMADSVVLGDKDTYNDDSETASTASGDDSAEEEFDEEIWNEERKRRRGIEDIHPRELSLIPFSNIQVSTLLSKLSYHSVEEMQSNVAIDFKTILSDQVPGFPIFVDGGSEFDTQAYIWLSRKTKTLFISFRGTNSLTDVKHDLDYRSIPLDDRHEDLLVHAGFRNKFKSVEPLLTEQLEANLALFDKIVFTGHSLGGALAQVAAPIIGEMFPQKYVEVLTFGAPRVGNEEFVHYFNTYVDVNYRITNDRDPVPSLPFESRFSHVSHAISLSPKGQVTKVPDAPLGSRFWYALEDLDLAKAMLDHQLETYIARIASILKKHD